MSVLDPRKLSPEDLTERLPASGALPHGRITGVHSGDVRTTVVSTIAPLRLEYSADAPSDAPARLFLKASRDGLDATLQSIIGQREVTFYRQVAPLMPHGPFVRYYDAEYVDSRFHLLFDDLSDTHTMLTQWPIPPTVSVCEQIIDTWAAVHAFWWRHPRLGRDIGTFADDAAIAKNAADVSRALRALRADARRPPVAAGARNLRPRPRLVRAAVHADAALRHVHARAR